MFENISGVYKVVEQKTLSYKNNLEQYCPTFVVHGDDWQSGFQKPVRGELDSVLVSYGGQLIEYPYARDEKYEALEKRARAALSLPDVRRARLKKALKMKGTISSMEAHSGLTGLLVEQAVVHQKLIWQQSPERVDNFADFDRKLTDVKARKELSFIEVKSNIASRSDLGRPTTSLENKRNFMGYLERV